jgi:hypothetical protein
MDPRSQVNDRRHFLKRMSCFILRRSIVQHHPFNIGGFCPTPLRELRPIPHCASDD